MEYFDELNEDGEKTGRKVEREEAHATGILHATSQIFIYRYHNGKLQILLQRRSENKDSFPGKLDISAAGHVPSGLSYDETAKKELFEELSIVMPIDKLERVGIFRTSKSNVFYGKPFLDEQFSAVYIAENDIDAENIKFQREEISQVLWLDADEIKKRINSGDDEFCINNKRFCIIIRAIEERIKILYEDEHMVVCIKPPSVPSQPDQTGDPDMITLLEKKLSVNLFPVHRLDRGTGGIMLFAKNAECAAVLSAVISDKARFEKRYFAVIEGSAPKDGTLTGFLIKSGGKAFVENRKRRGAKEAILSFSKLSESENDGKIYSLLDVDLKTGRFHQIRAQLSSIGCPVAGDGKYGGRDKKAHGALFAHRISFCHPKTGEKLTFDAEMPKFYPWNLFN